MKDFDGVRIESEVQSCTTHAWADIRWFEHIVLHGRSGRVSLSNSRMSHNSHLAVRPSWSNPQESSRSLGFLWLSSWRKMTSYTLSYSCLVIKTKGSCSNKVSADIISLAFMSWLVMVCLDREPHPLPRAKAMTCFSDHVYYSVPVLHSLFFLHRDSVRTACGRLYKYTLLPRYVEIGREESSLVLWSSTWAFFFDTAFWPFTACGQGFRQGSLRTLLDWSASWAKIIGQLIMHARHRGADFYSLRFSLLLTDLLPFESFVW